MHGILCRSMICCMFRPLWPPPRAAPTVCVPQLSTAAGPGSGAFMNALCPLRNVLHVHQIKVRPMYINAVPLCHSGPPIPLPDWSCSPEIHSPQSHEVRLIFGWTRGAHGSWQHRRRSEVVGHTPRQLRTGEVSPQNPLYTRCLWPPPPPPPVHVQSVVKPLPSDAHWGLRSRPSPPQTRVHQRGQCLV